MTAEPTSTAADTPTPIEPAEAYRMAESVEESDYEEEPPAMSTCEANKHRRLARKKREKDVLNYVCDEILDVGELDSDET